MAAGAKFFNTATGSIQIDETYKNLVLSEIRYIPIDYLNPIFDVNVTGAYAVIAYYCNIAYPYLRQSDFDGSSNWFFRFGSIWPTSGSGGTNDTMELYVFSEPTKPPTTVGIKIFNPTTGQITFQSSEKPMKFAAVLPNNALFTGTPGRKYAVCIHEYSSIQTFTTTDYVFPVPYGSFISPDQRPISGIIPGQPNAIGTYAAVDVTNY